MGTSAKYVCVPIMLLVAFSAADDTNQILPAAPVYQSYLQPTPAPTPISPPTFEDLFGFDLAEQARTTFADIQQFVLTLAKNKDTLPFINDLIDTNPCVSNLQGFLALLERNGGLIVKNAENLEDFVIKINSLRGERNITELTLFASDILMQLDDITRNLDINGLFLQCGGSGQKGIDAMREIALVFYKLSTRDDIPLLSFAKERQDSFLRIALTIEAITNGLDHFRKNLAKKNCFTSKDFLGDFIYLASETIYDLAEALGSLGYLPLAKEIRQYAAFTASLVGSLEKLEGFKIPDDCSSDSFRKAANSLRDVAALFEEVGLEALATELGVVLRLDLLP